MSPKKSNAHVGNHKPLGHRLRVPRIMSGMRGHCAYNMSYLTHLLNSFTTLYNPI